MTQEYKDLLFKDLSGRLSCGLKVAYITLPKDMPKEWDMVGLPAVGLVDIVVPGDYRFAAVPVEEIRPYLRSMSSMTEEEEKELMSVCPGYCEFGFHSDIYGNGTYVDEAFLAYDWLDKHHFDYRNLIFLELALEAPEGMYKVN